VTNHVDQPENADEVAPPPLARWPVVVVGVLILLASAIWMSCQEYASGTRRQDENAPSDGPRIVEYE
jgi:hypothetical protein